MNVDTPQSMAKHDDSVNRIPGRSIADIMPQGPSDRCHHQRSRLIGWPVARSMKWSLVQAGQVKDSKLRPSRLCCFSRWVWTFMPVCGQRKTIKSAISTEWRHGKFHPWS